MSCNDVVLENVARIHGDVTWSTTIEAREAGDDGRGDHHTVQLQHSTGVLITIKDFVRFSKSPLQPVRTAENSGSRPSQISKTQSVPVSNTSLSQNESRRTGMFHKKSPKEKRDKRRKEAA